MKIRYLILTISCIAISLYIKPATIYAQQIPNKAIPFTNYEQMPNNFYYITPKATATVWKYKVINGILYKRLYDNINNCWIGDWIPC